MCLLLPLSVCWFKPSIVFKWQFLRKASSQRGKKKRFVSKGNNKKIGVWEKDQEDRVSAPSLIGSHEKRILLKP